MVTRWSPQCVIAKMVEAFLISSGFSAPELNFSSALHSPLLSPHSCLVPSSLLTDAVAILIQRRKYCRNRDAILSTYNNTFLCENVNQNDCKLILCIHPCKPITEWDCPECTGISCERMWFRCRVWEVPPVGCVVDNCHSV